MSEEKISLDPSLLKRDFIYSPYSQRRGRGKGGHSFHSQDKVIEK